MKKLISVMMCAIMLTPAGMAFADATDNAADKTSEIAISAAADASYEADSTLLRAALMDSRMSCLALQAFSVDGSWDSQDGITDPWGAVYTYLNMYGLNGVESDENGAATVSADYIRGIFEDMYGEKYDELPVVSRMHSSVIVYDDKNDAYSIVRADGEGIYAVLSGTSLNDDGAAVMTYSIKSDSGDDAGNELGIVNITLSESAVSASGLMPISVEMIDMSGDAVG